MINCNPKKGRMNQAIPPSNDCYMRKLTVLSDLKKYIYTLRYNCCEKEKYKQLVLP
jgi:hypothetical protein